MLRKFFMTFLTVFTLVTPLPAYAMAVPVESTTPKPTRSFKVGPTIKKEFEIFKENKSASREAMREELKKILEQKKQLHEQQKEALQEKIAAFKDQRKKEIILKLDSKIASISSRRTERMSEALEKLESVLEKLKTRAATLSADCETTAFNSAITNAEQALASASAAVTAQGQKTYTIQVTDETTAKKNVGQTIKQLQQDLRSTHKSVMDAKQAVVKVAVELRKLKHCTIISNRPTTQPTVATTVNPTVTIEPTTEIEPTGE